ncbi:hypothetical protein GCM10009808_12600 [Microbacterium sediminicola]|uniref:HTH tetR-type domain-containing protein n=1 Tax=Microbacterium sediminicola TaxID=415210 RepID=A0ABN2I140_9MICO
MIREDSPEAQRLLGLAADVILERGVVAVSLSELARAIGSNNRMLLYYFGSKEELFARAIHTAYERFPDLHALIPGLSDPGDLVENLRTGWRRLRAPENTAYLTLFFEAFAAAVRAPEANRTHLDVLATHWPRGIGAAFRSHGFDEATAARAAVQLMVLWRGLQLELLAGTPVEALDAAHDEAVTRLFDA